MFLELAYFLFISQVIAILLMVLPIPIKIKRSIIESIAHLTNNVYVKITCFIIVVAMLGLFFENLSTVMRYSNILSLSTYSNNSNKIEIMLKLYRAQRNMYLTFIVNFNWFIIYGFRKLTNALFYYVNKDNK